MHSFEAVYARMLFAAKARTQSELADIIGIRQASISDAKKRKSIPSDWCMRLYDARGVKVDWQRFGRGPVYDEEKLRQNSGDWTMPEGDTAGFLREPEAPSLLAPVPGEMPYHSTCAVGDGFFPVIGLQMFPVEFLRDEVQIFRFLESCMAPVLNRGALVAVEKDAAVRDGDIVAVRSQKNLLFRRVQVTESGYILRTQEQVGVDASWHVVESDWPAIYYGKAIWAFQPL
ncbi:MAG: LexA family transcriptional regulator [Mailhella sp.]|nr:LexA family transcriptional regulator [Mailhella sp.]